MEEIEEVLDKVKKVCDSMLPAMKTSLETPNIQWFKLAKEDNEWTVYNTPNPLLDDLQFKKVKE